MNAIAMTLLKIGFGMLPLLIGHRVATSATATLSAPLDAAAMTD